MSWPPCRFKVNREGQSTSPRKNQEDGFVMKIVFVQADGMASAPLDELGGRTPLQGASTPNLDFLAGEGESGHLILPGENVYLSGERVHLALLGYDPQKFYPGPGPFAAASLEVGLEKQDVAFLCHLVTLRSMEGKSEVKKMGPQLLMVDDQAGGIESEEARELINAVNDQMGSETIQFYAGKGHRHLMVWAGGVARRGCGNPHAALGRSIEPYLPTGEGSDILKELMEASWFVLRSHPLNIEREEAGLNPANCLWLWGAGKAMELPKLADRWSMTGATISTSDLHLGVGICAGLEGVNPQEYEEFHHSDFSFYANVCQKALQTKDFVYIHVPSPIHGEMKNGQELVKCLEAMDDELIGTLLRSLRDFGDYCLLVTCNHDEERVSASSPGSTPFVLYKSSGANSGNSLGTFSEVEAGERGHRDATRMIERLQASP
jgi:2,3-bisphosphoglycerate-independent phosphoglycerate mutase